jgi:small subunit ribosomal protein S16
MPAKIRLRRMGRKKKAHYRVVVADNDSPRDGRFIESIGYYKPLSDPARLVLNLERVDHWLSEGAQPSGTMKSLIAKARKGGDSLVALGETDPEEQKAKRAEILAARRATEEQAAQKAAAAKAAEEPAEEEAAEEPAEEEAAEEPAEEEAAVSQEVSGDTIDEDQVDE